MIFVNLTLENFGVFQGKIEIDFKGNTEKHGQSVILIGGMNGRGKTTLLEGILLALYGRYSIAFKESGLTYSDYLRKYTNRSNHNTKSAVQLKFEVALGRDEVKLCVRRSWDCRFARIVEQVDVWVNDSLDTHVSQNWDLYMEEIVPAGIAGLFFFDGEKVSSIADNLSGEYTKRAIESLLGLDIIDRLVRDLRLIVDRTKGKFETNPLLEDTADLEEQRTTLLTDLESKERRHLTLSDQVENSRRDLAEAEELFLKDGGMLQESFGQLQGRKEQLSVQLMEEKAKLFQLAAGVTPLNLIRPLLETAREHIVRETDGEIARHIGSYLSQLSGRIMAILNGEEPALTQRISAVLQAERESLNPRMQAERIFDMSPIGIQQLSGFLSRPLEEDVNIAIRRVEYAQQLEQQLGDIEGLLSIEPDRKQIASRLESIKRISYQLSLAENELGEVTREIDSLQREVETVENRLRRIIETILRQADEEEDARRIIQYALTSIDMMRRYREELNQKKTKELASYIHECFTSLIHKNSLVKEIQMNPETFAITLIGANGDELLSSQLSTGERQMLAISILWGLGRASGKDIPVVIDTPMARLDSSHRYNYVKEYLPKASRQVIVLSTDEEVVGRYLGLLNGIISRRLLLVYDEDRKATRVMEGYFAGEVS